jgi:hypothetical protein
VFIVDLVNKTTTELKMLRDKLEFELSQRENEKELPVIRVIGGEVDGDEFTIENLDREDIQKIIINHIKDALKTKDRIFNIKLVMMAESDVLKYCKA